MAEEAMTDLKGPSSVALIAIWGCTAVFPKCFPASYNTSISVRCLLAELMALAGNSIPDEVGDKAGVGEGGLGDWDSGLDSKLAHLKVRQNLKEPTKDALREGPVQQKLPQPHYH